MRTIAVLLLLASPAAAQITGNVDYLYWRANSSDFHHFIDRGPSTEHAGSGVRAGIGYRLNCWEASWNYTYYASDAFGEQSYPINNWVEYLSCDDDLDYQVHDLQLLRRFCLGQCCELDIFGGFRWGQIDRTSQNLWLQDVTPQGQHSYLTSISRTDSYGGRLGGNFRVQLTEFLSWFASGAFSGLLSTTDTVSHDLNTIVPGRH
ncbi:MAG: hypothetical protein GXX96_04005 [Planctomycetaceae bacterium]|nr:hypothetical protein [Planctomycetaceae bacterium]